MVLPGTVEASRMPETDTTVGAADEVRLNHTDSRQL